MRILKITMIILFAHYVTVNAQTVNQKNDSGEKIGSWVKYHDNGKKKYEGQFHNDRPYGKFTYYYSNGNVKSTSIFSDDGIIAHNTTYYKTGKLLAEGKYINQKKDSIWRYYLDEESNPCISSETFVNGELNGESITYYLDTGKEAEIVFFKNGKKDGSLLKYFPDGTLMTKSYYKDGLPEGDFVHYHPNGKERIVGKYKDGIQVGEWKFYDENGEPMSEDDFTRDEVIKNIE